MLVFLRHVISDGGGSFPCIVYVFSWCCSISQKISNRTVFTIFFFFIHPPTHFHQSCGLWNSVAPFLHPDGPQCFCLKLLFPWSQHLRCIHTRPRGSQQQISFQ